MGPVFTWLRQAYSRSFLKKCPTTRSAWLGMLAEWRACLYLWRHGLRLLHWRYMCWHGELDLIMREGHVIVFIEVRYRSSDSHGGALLSVNRAKRNTVRRAANQYLRVTDPKRLCRVRFDIVAIEPKKPLCWRKAAFSGEE